MYICLNRATAGAGLPLDQFVDIAANADFQARMLTCHTRWRTELMRFGNSIIRER